MDSRWDFYRKTILKYMSKSSKILVIGASLKEVKIFYENNFENVTFGFYDEDELNVIEFTEFEKKFNFLKIDCRKINFCSNFFDFTFTHATIHHIDLPHLAITELFRVAKVGTLIIEGNDSFIMKLACKFNFSENFELSAIHDEKGGLLNSNVPNYIYRWTETEIKKLLNSYKPQIISKIDFQYSFDFFNSALEKNKLRKFIKYMLVIFLYPTLWLFKKQGNIISIFINKKESKERF